jgi:hypothetical protein
MSARPLAFSHPLLAPECIEAPATKIAALGPGGRSLTGGAAISLRPARAGQLRVLSGRAWVTLGGPYAGRGNELGDVFLAAGDSLAVPAGARMVIESAPDRSGQALRFDWCEAVAAKPAVRPGRVQREVLAPARELVLTLRQSARALWRLTWGVLGLADLLVAGRGRVLSRWESNPP